MGLGLVTEASTSFHCMKWQIGPRVISQSVFQRASVVGYCGRKGLATSSGQETCADVPVRGGGSPALSALSTSPDAREAVRGCGLKGGKGGWPGHLGAGSGRTAYCVTPGSRVPSL